MTEPELIQISILLENRLRPVPKEIGIETFVEDLKVVFETKDGRTYRNGDHVIIIGTEENIKLWLKPHSPICVSNANLMLQSFEMKDVA